MSFTQSTIKIMASVALLAGILVPSFVFSETVQDRIKPIGATCMAGDACAAAAPSAAGSGEPRSGESIYSTKCLACHATGAAGAPKLGDVADWTARLSERGLDGLYKSGVSGFKGMPPKGACSDCSDDEVKAAIDHILAKSK